LFDAVAALCGVRAEVNYEGQAAIELEAACDPLEQRTYPLPITGGVLDARATIAVLVDDLALGTPVARVAARFHNAIAAATALACAAANAETVVLSGGVFQNRRLLESTAQLLSACEMRVLTPEKLPVNDGGIAFGQAAIAAARSC